MCVTHIMCEVWSAYKRHMNVRHGESEVPWADSGKIALVRTRQVTWSACARSLKPEEGCELTRDDGRNTEDEADDDIEHPME